MKKALHFSILILLASTLSGFSQNTVSMKKYKATMDSVEYYKDEANKYQLVAQHAVKEAMEQQELAMWAQKEAMMQQELAIIAQIEAQEQYKLAAEATERALMSKCEAARQQAISDEYYHTITILRDSINILNQQIQELKQ